MLLTVLHDADIPSQFFHSSVDIKIHETKVPEADVVSLIEIGKKKYQRWLEPVVEREQNGKIAM